MVVKDERQSSIFAITIRKEKLKQIPTLETSLIFSDKQPSQEFIIPIRGIRKYGPYDTNTSDKHLSRKFRGVEFFVFYPKNEDMIYKTLSDLISMLRDGYFERRGSHDTTFEGFESEFKLKEVFIPEANEFIGYTPGNLQKELESRKIDFAQVFERGNRPIVIVGGTSHRSIMKNREQYLESKLQFTNLDLPCQYASYYECETSGAGILYGVRRKDRPFGYSLWNFALNIYGKVGGLAWVIRQDLSKVDSLVIDLNIGIRFVRSRSQKGFIIGYVTILDRFGRLIGVISSSPFKAQIEKGVAGMVVPREVMENIMVEVLKKAVNDVRVKEIFSEKETINIAIHRLSIFHSQEIQGIVSAIDKWYELKKMKIKYALISIIDKPLILVLNKLATYWNALRGTTIRLDDKVAILYTTGTTSLNDRGVLSYPITVIAQNLGEKKCPFTSLEEVCNYVYSLTNLHWQTVIAGSVRLPATLEFAENIARLSSFGIIPKENSWLWQTLWFV
jgi:hypothetical protein